MPPHANSCKTPRNVLLMQFFQYVMVGGAAFVLDFSVLYGLTEFVHFHYLFSATVGFLLGLILNYILCIYWIFDYRALENASHEFAVFALIGLLGLLASNALLYFFTENLGMHYLISKLMAAFFVLIFNFSLRRHLLFSNSRCARWVQQLRTSQPASS